MRLPLLLSLCLLLLHIDCGAVRADELCQYLENGRLKVVSGRDAVPAQFISSATCKEVSSGRTQTKRKEEASSDTLADPDAISLKGNIRREDISSNLGRIKLRWPRAVETLFGRTPLRAMTEAANVVNRSVNRGGFPAAVQTLNADWHVVFMDENLPEGQIPYSLVSNCHPGWMTPPANIYIVAQRAAAGCGGPQVSPSVADSQLARVLIHELGHAVEFHLLDGKQWNDRMRSEGFATWFEGYAAEQSSLVNSRTVKAELTGLAKQALQASPAGFQFSGSAYDYARASLYFRAIENQRGVIGIMDVYKKMREDNLSFFVAVQEELGWNRERFEKEAARAAK